MALIEVFGTMLALQFEPHGQGFLYRQNYTGAPVPVTAEERRAFVRAFGWQFLLHVVGLMAAIVAAAMVTAIFFPAGDEPGGFVLMGGLLLAIAGGLYVSIKWAMASPARALAGRATVGPPRTRP